MHGRLVLVSGESGIGKTALVEAFQSSSSGTRWLWGACDGLLTPRPLGPLFDIGAQLDGELAVCAATARRGTGCSTRSWPRSIRPRAFTVVVIEDAALGRRGHRSTC